MVASLSLLMLLLLSVSCFLKVSRLKSEARQSEQEVIETLKERFKKIPPETVALEDVISEAQRELIEKKKSGLPFLDRDEIQSCVICLN